MDSIRYMVHFMHCAFLAMEPQTGAVKAWSWWHWFQLLEIRYKGNSHETTQALHSNCSVYTEAMESGLTPCDKRRDEYIYASDTMLRRKTRMTTWTPSNANGSFSQIQHHWNQLLQRSINSAVRLGQEMGIKRIMKPQSMRIKSARQTPSLALRIKWCKPSGID